MDRRVFARPSLEVAPLLLGARLSANGVAVRITEVEAYLGADDPGSHAFRGRTRRNGTMFGEPGHLYTYFTYGMHVCCNVVCSPASVATAVLIRAGEVVDGIDLARERRTTSKKFADLARGPARLTVALGITLDFDGIDLCDADADAGAEADAGALSPGDDRGHLVRLELGDRPVVFAQGPRTGVSGPGGTDEFPWRFWIPGDPTVSPYKASASNRRGVKRSTGAPAAG
jgi:DNA-3-methyladenine glycosylase